MKKFKVLQIGCGGISKSWLTNLVKYDEIDIVGLVDLNLTTANERKNEFNLICRVFTDFKLAIDELHPDIVIDNTLPSIHHQIVTHSLEKGCHVFGEKPLADTMEHAKAMVAAADKANRYYSVMQNRRYMDKIKAFNSIIKDKKIGELGFLNAEFYIEAHFGGFRDAMESPLILDMAIHSFDQARFISGCDPISVYCQEFNLPGSWYQGAASAVCIFEMSNGVIFSYNGSWSPKGLLTSWECKWKAYGSKGSSSWDGSNLPMYELVNKDSEKSRFPNKYDKHIVDIQSPSPERHEGCILNMIESLKKDIPSKTDCHDNIKSLAMVMGAIKSSTEQRKVYISELF